MSSEARTCQTCDAEIPAGWYFCGQCGAQSDAEAVAGQVVTRFYGPMQAPGRAKLILIVGEAIEGMSYHLNALEHVTGHMNGQLPFDDPCLSPEHATFYYRDGQLYVRDEDSLNGTYVRVREQRELQDGDMIIAGDHYFRFDRIAPIDDTPTSDGTQHITSPDPGISFRIVDMLRGGIEGRAYASPNNEVAVGREACDMNYPQDIHLSKRHFKIKDTGGTFVLRDLDSKNGTYIRIRREARLFHGDLVFVGQQLLRVEIT